MFNFKHLYWLAIVAVLACTSVFASDNDTDDDEITKGMRKLTLQSSKDLTLRRPHVKYANTLGFGNGRVKYKLTFQNDHNLAMRAFAQSQQDPNRYKNHLFAQAFNIHKCNDGTVVRQYNPLEVNNFPLNEIDLKTNYRIDWMSKDSGCKNGDDGKEKFFRRRSYGHSEPQVLADLRALLFKNPSAVVKTFLPSSFKKVDQIITCGLELFGSFDACNDCVGDLIKFRKEHQAESGKTIYATIKAHLEDKGCDYTEYLADQFVLIYHAARPYIYADYYAYHEGKRRSLEADCNLGFKATSKALTKTTLAQQKFIEVDENLLYAHIHAISGQKEKFHKDLRTYRFT